MTDRRDPRIREAVVHLALSSPPAPEFDELTADRSSPGLRHIPAWATVVAAAAIVLVVIGGVSLLLDGSNGSSEASPAAQSTTAAPVPTTVPDAAVVSVDSPVGAITWTSAQVPRELADITVIDGAYVARSIHNGPGGVWAEAVVSTDGLTWTPLPTQPVWAGTFTTDEIESSGVPYNVAFVPYEGGLLSVTAFTSGKMPVAEWLSEVDSSWSDVSLEPASGINNGDVSSAAGSAGAIIFAGSADGEPLMWVLGDEGFELINDSSIDALPVPDSSVPYTDAGLAGYLRGSRLHATESGFLAEFFIADDTGIVTASPLRYQSSDGRDWTAVAGPDMEIWDTDVRDGMTMAVGERGIQITSDNGSTWRPPQGTEEQLSGMIEAGPLGWIMPTGQVGIFFDSIDIQISTDATNWETILQPNGAVTGMAVDEAQIVVATVTGWENTTYRIWVGHVTP
jgi:hypothetical protein